MGRVGDLNQRQFKLLIWIMGFSFDMFEKRKVYDLSWIIDFFFII